MYQIVLLAVVVNWFVIGKMKWQLVSHPLNVVARVLKWMACGRRGAGRAYGFVFVLSLCLVSGTLGLLLHMLFSFTNFGWGLEVVLVSTLLARRGLFGHINTVVDRLYSSNVLLSKYVLSTIIGRRIGQLGEREICELCVLSLIENFNATALPSLFYYMFGGLPILMVFKLVELADSILRDFNYVNSAVAPHVAKLDDALRCLPFAITGSLIFCFAKLVKAVEAFLCGKTKCVFRFQTSRLAEALTSKIICWCLGRNLNTSKTCNGVFIEGENLNLNLSKPEGVSVKRCEVIICIAYLLILAWGLFEFCSLAKAEKFQARFQHH
ncbi:MAG: cobalamin biosynthesis protein [Candidatus Hodgkinia cicadicola]